MTNGNASGSWLSVLEKAVWPIFIGILLLGLGGRIGTAFDAVLAAIGSGRAVETPWFKLGEAARSTAITGLTPENPPITALAGPADAIEKGSGEFLREVQERARKAPGRRIDTLLLNDGTEYSPEILRQYIGSLGVRFVVFQKGGRFDAWIKASGFAAQLPPPPPRQGANTPTMRPEQMRERFVGISSEKVEATATARDVLGRMQDLHTDSLPVVDANGKLLFFTDREDILARLLTSLLLQK